MLWLKPGYNCMPDAAEVQMMLSTPYCPGRFPMKKTPFAIIMVSIITTMTAAHIMAGITAIAYMKAVTAIHRNSLLRIRSVNTISGPDPFSYTESSIFPNRKDGRFHFRKPSKIRLRQNAFRIHGTVRHNSQYLRKYRPGHNE